MKVLLAVAGMFIGVITCMHCSSAKVKQTGQTQTAPVQDSLQQARQDELTGEERDQLNKILRELEDVPFDFDSYTIPVEGLDIIKQDVEILNTMLTKRGKFIKITIEGHCDDRGSEEYNLALGERRAKTVKTYLVNAGFADRSLLKISYGEEKPKVQGNSPEAWAANRRVHLVAE